MPSFLQLVPTFVHTKQFSFTWQCIFLIEFNFCTFCWMVVLHFSTTLIATLIGMLLCIISSYIYLLFSSNFDVTGMHMTLPYLHFRNQSAHSSFVFLSSFLSPFHHSVHWRDAFPAFPLNFTHMPSAMIMSVSTLKHWLNIATSSS